MGKVWKIGKWYTMMIVSILFLGVGMKSEAAVVGKASGLKQTLGGPNRIEVSWNAVIGNHIRYKVELCENKNFTGGVMDNLSASDRGTAQPKESFSGLTAGSRYYVRVTAFVLTDDPVPQFTWGAASKVLEVVTAPENDKVKNLRQTKASETSITISWKKSAGANAYQLTFGKKGGDAKNRKVIQLGKVNTYTAKNLSKNTEYDFWLNPVRKSSSGFWALGSHTTYLSGCPVLPTKIKGVEASFWSPTSEHLDLGWKKSDSADGYQYQIFAEDGKKALLTGKKAGDGNSTYLVTGKLKSLRFLRLRVRGYIEIPGGSKYGKWSDWLYFSRQPDVVTKNTKGGILLTWDKVSGARNYSVYISTKRTSGYKKVESTAKTSATVRKCGKASLKLGKQYYFMVVANKRVGKKNYQSTRNYCFWITYRQ